METSPGGAAFAPRPNTYLNTASAGLLPVHAASALKAAVDATATGEPSQADVFEARAAARAGFARLAGVPIERVALGSSVAVHIGMIATALPSGAEVLVADGDFSSLINPFAVRPDLRLRSVPLDDLASAVRSTTALVAVSRVQSADGRLADLTAIRAAARAHGAQTLVDATQSAGWLPLDAADDDYTVCGGFKWLLCPRGVSFLVIPPLDRAFADLTPLHAGWCAGDDLADSVYGVVALASSGRRYDESPNLSYLAAHHCLELIESIGVPVIREHNLSLADRFRTELTAMGHKPLPGPSAIVAVPGLGSAQETLRAAGVVVSARAGNLRASFHLYNTSDDVDRALEALAQYGG
ncbi:aminotransferase class V-fold PLP-dependent enzyme [Streptomyces sp. URMC 123]|uniref:aminotransferase class V-fold PLP-dependent enzyme n=1 Tax=Streptomyces sp. URMC 123 TaxID=3423403 RepID=UPI003F1AB1F7